MRIGFFTDSYFPKVDGVTYTLETWKKKLEDRGHEVYIIYPENSDYTPGPREIPVRSLPNPFYPGYRIPLGTGTGSLPELDIVHSHGPATLGMTGRMHAWRNDIPSIYTHHTPVEEYFEQAVHSRGIARALEKIYVPLENAYLKSFDVVTASTPVRKREVDHVQLPVGVDMEFFHPRKDSFLDELDLDRPVAGYSGRLSLEKNAGELLDFARDFDGTLIVVGEGPQEEKLRDEASGNVLFHEFLDREKLPEFYSGIDVYVTASRGDTLGLSPLEANSCGTPVVAPDIHPFDTTISGENGERYTPGDAGDLGEKVLKAAEGNYSTRTAVEDYSLQKTVDSLERLYRSTRKG